MVGKACFVFTGPLILFKAHCLVSVLNELFSNAITLKFIHFDQWDGRLSVSMI